MIMIGVFNLLTQKTGGYSLDGLEAMIRLRMSQSDAHYGGNLVDGSKILSLFGDIATELLIKLDGDEGLFFRYDEVQFLAPVYAGDYIEATGWLVKKSRTARVMEFEAKKVIRYPKDPHNPSRAEFLQEPIIVTKAKGVCVTPEEKQNRKLP
jgi:3-aminobutyryl-CoA ammonia-lyase